MDLFRAYVVVGTAYSCGDDEYEPSAGRVLVLSLTSSPAPSSSPGPHAGQADGDHDHAMGSSSSWSPSSSSSLAGPGAGSGVVCRHGVELVAERLCKGAVYDIGQLGGGGALACGVGSNVQVRTATMRCGNTRRCHLTY